MDLHEKNYNSLISEIEKIMNCTDQDVTQENANTSGNEPQGMMSLFASATAKMYALNHLLSEESLEAYEKGYNHIHDLDYYPTGTTTCLQIPLGKLLKGGFSVKDSYMREPSNIFSAMSLMAVILQSHQNQQHGGQSMTAVDYDLAPYVKKTWNKHLQVANELKLEENHCIDYADKQTEKDTLQAAEAFVHNMNTMMCRGGGQTVFSSVNFGLDTTKEGRLVSKSLLDAMYNGVGNGEQPIFPIMIFQTKEEINLRKGTPNYDLFQQALKTTAKRFFPNYAFCDATFNLRHFDINKPETWVSYMGCRTRTLEDIHGSPRTIGRGNLSFSTINLPMIALESQSVEEFFRKLDKYADITIKQLHERYLYQISKKVKNFSFIFGQKTYFNSDHLEMEDTLEDALKHGTLSVGFIGLAETLTALIGKHHGESQEAYELGIKIVEFLNKKTEEAKQTYKLNYAVLATPAESYCGKALKKIRHKYGILKGISDKEFLTNSYHIPVNFPISVTEKIRLEGAFHKLCLAGHISYVELDSLPTHNIKALEKIVLCAKDNNMGYFAINIPVDKCLDCGYDGQIDNECPSCGNKRETRIKRIRRITGYLVGDMSRWNSGKQSEESLRVKHNRYEKQ